jgi:hypothetical protein
MAAQDLGNLADYLVNGDNYERIDPASGNTLVIPGNQIGTQPVPPSAPQGDTINAYRIPSGDCSQLVSDLGASCAAWVHDATTGFYHIGPIADYNPSAGEDCICALAGMLPSPNCLAALQAQIDALTGTPEWLIMPRWFLAQQGVDFFATFVADFWFVACFSAEIIIPGPTKPPPNVATCPAPLSDRTAAGCPAGFFVDPSNAACCKPLDPPVPSHVRNLAGLTRSGFGVPAELEPFRVHLSRTRFDAGEIKVAQPPPLPMLAVMPLPAGKCGCETTEEIDVL